MLAPDRSPLAGLVEVDETEITCRSKNDPLTGGGGRSHQGKVLVVGAVEVVDSGAGPGRTRHAAFRSLLGIAAVYQPLTYNMLLSPEAQL
jgi:hypothetical protein